MVTQTKPLGGTEVDFTNAIPLKNLNKISYPSDIIGVLSYQSAPVTVDASIRNACLNGDVTLVETQINGQGMSFKYGVVSWVENQNDGQFTLTDFRVGVVAQVVRSYNTGASYLIDCLKAVPWLNQIMLKLSLPWQGWQLATFSRDQALLYRRIYTEAEGEPQWVAAPIGETPPDLPDATAMKNDIMTYGDFNTALGKFTTDFTSKGFSVTYPPNGYGVDVCYYKSPVTTRGYYVQYYYIPYVRFWWDVSTVPDFTTAEPVGKYLAFLTMAFIIAILKVVAIIIIATVPLAIIAWNLTYKKSEVIEYDYVRNADGSPYIDPATGKPVFYVAATATDEGQPIDWNFFVTVVGLGIGAGIALYLYGKSGRRKSEQK